MFDYTSGFIRLGLVDDPNPLPPYHGRSFAELPNMILEIIFMKTSPGDPEALRASCVKFNRLYKAKEEKLPIRKQPGTSMELSQDAKGFRVRISGRAKGHDYDFELMNPNSRKLTKFFRVAGEVTFSTFDMFPAVFQGQFPRFPFKTLLAQQDFTVVNMKSLDPIITRYILELFDDTSKLKWFTNDEEAMNIDVDDLQRIQYMTSTETMSNVTLARVLENHRTLPYIRLTLNEEFNHYYYVDQWFMGTRSFKQWYLKCPNYVNYDIDHSWNKEECDCGCFCARNCHGSVFSLYVGTATCAKCENEQFLIY